MMGLKVLPYSIDPCFGDKGCPNSIENTEQLIKEFEKILKEEKIDEFIISSVKGRLKMHNTFRIGIANCPNACSQVHIKDFAIIVRAKVGHIEEKCNLCKKCLKACPDQSIYLNNGKIEINFDKCLNCGLCARICTENAIVIKKIGYSVLAGGKLGRHPSLSMELDSFVENKEKLLDYFKKVLYFYKENCKNGERLGSIIQRVGIQKFLSIKEEGEDEVSL